jgi:UDP-N-acetylmuramoyl-tripeptide--D-alanyl-D-alanine ligase
LGVLSQNASDVFDRDDGFHCKGQHFSEVDELIESLTMALVNENQDISILVKGCRSARMERVVAAIEKSPVAYFERLRERVAC